jgi:signal transduction histidine kinase
MVAQRMPHPPVGLSANLLHPWVETRRDTGSCGVPQYPNEIGIAMNTQARLLRALGLGMIALVFAMAAFGDVGFGAGTEGGALVGSASAFSVAGAIFLLRNAVSRTAALLLFTVMGGSLIAVYALDFTSTPVGLFLLGAFAALREPRGPIALVLALSLLAHNGVQASAGHENLPAALATDAGVAFFLLLGHLLVRERTQREHLDALLAEVETRKQSERAASVIAERGRMARELHDVLAHTLSGLALHLEAARLLAGKTDTDPALAESVDHAHRLAKTGLQEAKRAVGALRGEDLPGAGLLPRLIEEHRLSSSGGSSLTVSGSPVPLVPEADLALYRATQEALSNVRKHATGASVSVSLDWGADQVVLVIEDTGGRPEGMSLSAGAPGYGLTGMSERTILLGGELETGPTGEGYRVRLAVPYAANLQV